jgi:ankyrin repeat protein
MHIVYIFVSRTYSIYITLIPQMLHYLYNQIKVLSGIFILIPLDRSWSPLLLILCGYINWIQFLDTLLYMEKRMKKTDILPGFFFLFIFVYSIIGCSRNPEGFTLLHWAAKKGDLALVKTLVQEKEMNVNARDKEGRTPLYIAAREGYRNCVDYLIKNGAETGIRDKEGMTILHWAGKEGYSDIIELLVKDEELVNIKDKKGYTPLQWAFIKDHKQAAVLLILAGSHLSLTDSRGNTLLHWAAENGYINVVKLLIEKGVNLNAKNKAGYVPFHLAADKNHKGIVQMLIDAGAEVSIHWPKKPLF